VKCVQRAGERYFDVMVIIIIIGGGVRRVVWCAVAEVEWVE
jgi:hypothetical protein